MLTYYTIVFETADCLIIACSVMQKHVLRLLPYYITLLSMQYGINIIHECNRSAGFIPYLF